MLCPYFERCALLRSEIVPLINADDSGKRAGDVVEQRSTTGRLTPSLAQPLAKVRRRSCSRQGAIGSNASAVKFRSRRVFARENPLTNVLPVVVKTNAEPLIRGRPAMTSSAACGKGTSCARLFLVLDGGSDQAGTGSSSRSSSHRMPATSSRRAPVRARSMTIGAKG